jgi:IPTL-CTERM motif
MNKIKISFFVISMFLLLHDISSAQGLRIFDDEESFNSICPDLAFEGFEDTKLPPGVGAGCLNPINSTTDGPCYAAGALIPGFSFTTSDPVDNVLGLTPPAFSLPSVGVGANLTDPVINFTPAVRAASIVITTIDQDSPADVLVFGPDDVLLGSTTVNLSVGDGTFLGFLSDESPITRIVVDRVGSIKVLTDLSFGPCDLVRPIPTLGELGLIAMAGILGLAGFMVLRRRKATA